MVTDIALRRWAAALLLAATPVLTLAAQDVMGTDNDPRVGLRAGAKGTAEQVLSNMKLLSYSPKPVEFDSTRGLAFVNSDLAFSGDYVYQGNFSGFMVWNIANPSAPVLVKTVVCPTDQGDPSIYGNLLFISAESPRGRTDCGSGGVQDGKDRARGVRIFDISNPQEPRLIKTVQTCRGSHTNTLVPDPKDPRTLYIYVGGTSSVRDSSEVPGCSSGSVEDNPNTAQYRIDIIKVPLDHPEQADVVTSARLFTGLGPRPGRGGGGAAVAGGRGAAGGGAGRGRGGGGGAGRQGGGGGQGAGVAAGGRQGGGAQGRGGQGAAAAGRGRGGGRGGGGPSGCHDMTSYPALNLLAGSCLSHGLLVDVSNPEQPVRLDAVTDSNFSLWHTAVFSNDGKKLVFTDEWGGGTAPRCRATDPQRLGGNTVLTIGDRGSLTQHGYFKMLAAQTEQENCVSHNGGLVPVPGRDIMVQGWYQGGVDVFDFTNPDHPVELAYFDRGPVSDESLVVGGSWGAYWYNGYIYSSELSRGLDILELTPSDWLSANEIAAAKLVNLAEYNPQAQPKIVWPAAFPVVRSYLDQLVRNEGLPSARTAAISAALRQAEAASGAARKSALTALAATVDADVAGAKDAVRVRAMAGAIRDLAAATN